MPSHSLTRTLEFQCEVNRLLIESGVADERGPMLSKAGMESLRTAFANGETPAQFVATVLLDPALRGATESTRREIGQLRLVS